MTQSTPPGEDADRPSSGAFYVGARAADAPDGRVADGVIRQCVHCGEDVFIEPHDAHFADSCAAVACSHCTGTSEGILYIAP